MNRWTRLSTLRATATEARFRRSAFVTAVSLGADWPEFLSLPGKPENVDVPDMLWRWCFLSRPFYCSCPQKKIQEYFVHLARAPRSQHDWQRALAVDPADVRNRWRERGSWSQEPWIWDVDVVDLLGYGYLQINLTVTWHSYGNHGSFIIRWCTYVKWWFSMAVLVCKRAMDMVVPAW